jgi:hypothetical protein
MAMSEDWYVASIDRVTDAAHAMHQALDRLTDALQEARSRRLAAVPLLDIIEGLVARGGREMRLSPTMAFREFEQAVTAYRAAAVRALVDDEGRSFTEIGDLTGVSRQMIARLYRRACAGGGTGPAGAAPGTDPGSPDVT